MINTVYNILKPLNIPVLFLRRPKIDKTNKIGISFHFFNESYNLYGDGNGNESGGVLQIDVFSLIDYTNVVNQIKQIMKENKFRLADSRDSDDSMNEINYYQKILIFNYIESEVKKDV